ncbi:glycoprotein [Nkolbisson virus]|uniref:Glycoprotein n=1 Tax=Nkolbisson virus TaxID=380442 RepID=A0A0D3R1P3_9RHAB|nr:glycoprotein [Nkolbisson virus]AJR28541.1 glycoprotein [Nkolbisson virus]
MQLSLLMVMASLAQSVTGRAAGRELHDVIGFVPDTDTLQWKPANLDTLRCPEAADPGPDDGAVVEKWVISRPRVNTFLGIKGYLCHYAKWVTRCEYTWYLSKTISRSIQPLDVTESGCQDAFKEYDAGRLVPGSFPPEACYWASTNDETVHAYTITPHEVIYDPYSNAKLDHIFLHGSCNKDFCETSHDSTMWIAKRKGEGSVCQFVGREDVEIIEGAKFSLRKFQTKVWLRGPSLHNIPLDKLCKIDFCGKTGYRNQQGIWFSIDRVSWSKNHSLPIRQKAVGCKPGENVAVVDTNLPDSDLEATIEEMMWDMNCLNALETIQHHKKVSLHDLYQIAPQKSGPGLAYRLNDGHLEVAQAHYWSVQHPKRGKLSRTCLGARQADETSSCVKWNKWTHVANNTYHAVNGITEVDGQILFPKRRVLHRKYDPEYATRQSLRFIKHPVIDKFEDKATENIEHKDIISKDVNAGDLVGNWVVVAEGKLSEWFGGLGKSIISVVSLIVGLLVLYVIVKLCLYFRPKAKEKIGDMEMKLKKRSESFG